MGRPMRERKRESKKKIKSKRAEKSEGYKPDRWSVCYTLVHAHSQRRYTINEGYERCEKSKTSGRLSAIANRNFLVDHAVPEIPRFT